MPCMFRGSSVRKLSFSPVLQVPTLTKNLISVKMIGVKWNKLYKLELEP